MTQGRNPEEEALEALFAAERASNPTASEDFLARVESDALEVQQRIVTASGSVARPARWFSWSNWGAIAGLATCLVLGVGLGGGLSTQIGALGDYYLSGGGVASEGLFLTSYDDLLLNDGG